VMRHAGLRIVKLFCGTIEAHGGDYPMNVLRCCKSSIVG